MKRRLFTILSALSLMLCVATCALWVRSYWLCDAILLYDGDHRTFQLITAVRGRIQVVFARTKSLPAQEVPESFLVHESEAAFDMFPRPRRFLGVGWGQSATVPPWFWRPALSLPHAYVAFLAAIMPGVQFYRRLRRQNRGSRGLCLSCGYDLRASPDRCPECGTETKMPGTTTR